MLTTMITTMQVMKKVLFDNFALIIFNNDDDSLEYQNNSF